MHFADKRQVSGDRRAAGRGPVCAHRCGTAEAAPAALLAEIRMGSGIPDPDIATVAVRVAPYEEGEKPTSEPDRHTAVALLEQSRQALPVSSLEPGLSVAWCMIGTSVLRGRWRRHADHEPAGD